MRLLHSPSPLRSALAAGLFAGAWLTSARADMALPPIPDRVILNLTATPAASVAVTWRTTSPASSPQVEVALAGPTAAFADTARRVPARSEPLAREDGTVAFHHSAILDELQPATLHAYRVGQPGAWSEWNQFTTAHREPAPFTFVWFGDPQDQIAEHCSRVFRQAVRRVPDAAFWLFSGDLCAEPVDPHWEELFSAAGFACRTCPSIMTPGNHDMGYLRRDGAYLVDEKGRRKRGGRAAPIWRAHLTLPENGPPHTEEESFCVDYQGVRFLFLNSNLDLAAQRPWLDARLADRPGRWTIAVMHHPLYSVGRTRDVRTTREAFRDLFDRHGVDLVLTGHDHAYARSHPLRADRTAPAGEHGTVYVVSSSGPKTYVAQPLYHALMARTSEHQMLFQAVTVDGPTLTFESRTATGELHDRFVLTK